MRNLLLTGLILTTSLGAWGEQGGFGVNGSLVLGQGGGGPGFGLSYLFANDTQVAHEIGFNVFHEEHHEFPLYTNQNDYLVFYNIVFGLHPESQGGFFWFLGGGSWIVDSLYSDVEWSFGGAANAGFGWVFNQNWEIRLSVPLIFAEDDGKLVVGGGVLGSFGYRF